MTQPPSLLSKHYRTLSYVSGPLIFVERVQGVGYGEIVELVGADGVIRSGQVLEVNGDRAVVQVFTGTRGRAVIEQIEKELGTLK